MTTITNVWRVERAIEPYQGCVQIKEMVDCVWKSVYTGWTVKLRDGRKIKYIPASNAEEAIELMQLTPEWRQYLLTCDVPCGKNYYKEEKSNDNQL